MGALSTADLSVTDSCQRAAVAPPTGTLGSEAESARFKPRRGREGWSPGGGWPIQGECQRDPNHNAWMGPRVTDPVGPPPHPKIIFFSSVGEEKTAFI